MTTTIDQPTRQVRRARARARQPEKPSAEQQLTEDILSHGAAQSVEAAQAAAITRG
jgi:hypothetical protein